MCFGQLLAKAVLLAKANADAMIRLRIFMNFSFFEEFERTCRPPV
jgi:hypothetical protein